jgi:preprotein translocase subunit YajC
MLLKINFKTLVSQNSMSSVLPQLKRNSKPKDNIINSNTILNLVRNGGVLVQRSRSYARPENQVLPSQLPANLRLRETNMLTLVNTNNNDYKTKEEDMFKRTWRPQRDRNSEKKRLSKLDFNSSVTSGKGDLISLNKTKTDEPCVAISLNKNKQKMIKSKLNSASTSSVLFNEDSRGQKSISKQQIAISPITHKQPKNIKKLKSKSFLTHFKSPSVSSLSSVASANKQNFKDKTVPFKCNVEQPGLILLSPNHQSDNQSPVRKTLNDNIEIISRFPINSKVYRHYISDKKEDKLTNSINIVEIIKNKNKRAEEANNKVGISKLAHKNDHNFTTTTDTSSNIYYNLVSPKMSTAEEKEKRACNTLFINLNDATAPINDRTKLISKINVPFLNNNLSNINKSNKNNDDDDDNVYEFLSTATTATTLKDGPEQKMSNNLVISIENGPISSMNIEKDEEGFVTMFFLVIIFLIFNFLFILK